MESWQRIVSVLVVLCLYLCVLLAQVQHGHLVDGEGYEVLDTDLDLYVNLERSRRGNLSRVLLRERNYQFRRNLLREVFPISWREGLLEILQRSSVIGCCLCLRPYATVLLSILLQVISSEGAVQVEQEPCSGGNTCSGGRCDQQHWRVLQPLRLPSQGRARCQVREEVHHKLESKFYLNNDTQSLFRFYPDLYHLGL